MPMRSTLTGNIIILKIGGSEVGRAQNITADSDFGLEDVSGIGDVEVQEHVNTKITHTLTVDKFIINKKTLLGLGIVPVSEDVLTMGVIDIEILTTDGTLVKKYESCSCANYSLRVAAHRHLWHYLVTGNENSEYRGKPVMAIPRHLVAVTTTKEHPVMDGGIVWTSGELRSQRDNRNDYPPC